MDYYITKILPENIKPVHEILRRCGNDMKERFDLDHWVPPFPIHLMQKNAEERLVYAVNNNEGLVGTFTISTKPLEYYLKDLWKYPDEQAIYVCHLAVVPERQGEGIGTWCMHTIEQIARDSECGAVRLDAYEKYDKLIKFYARLDYERRGIVEHQRKRLVCLEKIIE
jgi:GNAT superfamily N-acetyltransferase